MRLRAGARGVSRHLFDPGSGVPAEVAVGRAGIDFDPNPAVSVANQLGGQLGVVVEGQHLLDLELVDADRVGGYAQRIGTRSQRDLGERRGRHDRLAENLVIGQPGGYVGSDIGPPHVVSAAGHLDVGAE
ncbi:hypothetical protein LAUMK35_01951 [Mycobacterium pseudokansasii]|nr:hypothetical protein LAUMK35_01951 [Mycobacterium pseudokansasii]VAZ93421.1 hypothetical protein LAUMK21_01953 [Mycobacterium pseudokansasii]